MKFVIMCGGRGKKLWPFSKSSYPKQFVPFINNQSLFQLNWFALRKQFRPEDIYIQTNPAYAEIALEQVSEIKPNNVFIEPESRNQGPATGFCIAKLFKISPDEPFMIIQSDVYRSPTEEFINTISLVESLIKKYQVLVTGSIKTHTKLNGVDFILPGEKIGSDGVFHVKRIVHRNEIEPTLEFDGLELYCHANHYSWTPRLFLYAFQTYSPEWYIPLSKMLSAFDTKYEKEVVRAEYSKMPIDPIEARVTNHAIKKGLVFECPFQWTDFSTWDVLVKFLEDQNRCYFNLIIEKGAKKRLGLSH